MPCISIHSANIPRSVMASSMKLEYPLNDALPNIEHTRDRLLARIFDFRKNGDKNDIATDEDYELLYAYGKLKGHDKLR